MNQLRFLVCLLVFAVCACNQDENTKAIWEDMPGTATEVDVKEVNNIIIHVANEKVVKIEGVDSSSDPGKDLEYEEPGSRADFVCDLGTFRVTAVIDATAGLREIAQTQESAFEICKKAFTLTENSAPSKYWAVRAVAIPIGCSHSFFYFESKSKCGFISGHVNQRPRLLMIFDKQGDTHATIIPIELGKIKDWQELVDRLVIKFD